MGTFGVPVNQVKAYIEADDAQRKTMSTASAGIPMDTLRHNDQLSDWVSAAVSYGLADYNEKEGN